MARITTLVGILVFASPTWAGTIDHDDGVALCMHQPDRAADARHRRAGWIIPDEPLTEPCPPGYRPVHRFTGGHLF